MQLPNCLLTMMLLGTAAYGDVVNEDFKLLASDGVDQDRFGWSVSIDGDTAVIGAYQNENHPCCPNAGAAYVFRLVDGQWIEEAKLLANDGDENDEFGNSVSLSGNAVVIGAWGDDATNGSAYIYRFNGSQWMYEAKLLPPDRAVNDRFGCAVSIEGDIVLIGAFGNDDNGSDSGTAYVYRFDDTQWTQEAKLLASDGSSGDYFGHSVSLSDSTAVIGAHYDDDSGSAYVYRFDDGQWTQEAKLLASDGAIEDRFGHSVSIFGDTAAIGAYGNDDNGSSSGSAYVYRFDGKQWAEEAKLLASDGASIDYFGYSVSISGNTAAIGAYRDDDNGSSSGSAYVYRFDGTQWAEEAKLLANDAAVVDFFGTSVSLSGDRTVIGAYNDEDNGNTSGSAYVFDLELPGTDCLADVTGDGLVNVSDILAVISAWGRCKGCPEDIDSSGSVDVTDLLSVISAWGDCP